MFTDHSIVPFFVEKTSFSRYENNIKNIKRIFFFPNLYMIFIMIRISVLHYFEFQKCFVLHKLNFVSPF